MRKIKNLAGRLAAFLKTKGIFLLFWIYFKRIADGYKVYKSILEKYGNDIRIFVEHYPGTGDIYLTCALLESYLKKMGNSEKYVVTIIGKGSVKIANLLGITDTVLLTQQESDDLLTLYRFVGPELMPNVTVLHYSPIMFHSSILDQMAGYNGLDFMTMYLQTVFPGVTWQDSKHFKPCNDQERILEYLDEKALIPGKTVVLFPFANTIEHVAFDRWERLARHLREDGFTVCTNVEKGGPVVPGTLPIFVPYADLRAFVETCGYAIGLRSGVFDIIADADCDKIVLYPTPNFYKFGVGTIFDYFSLVKMGIAKRTYEFEFERVNEVYVFRKVYELVSEISSGKKPSFVGCKKCCYLTSHDVNNYSSGSV